MGIERMHNTYRVKARLRVNGKIVQKQCTLTGSREEAKALFEKMKAELRATDTAGRSLKLKTLGEIISFYRARHTVDHDSESYFRRLVADLGRVPMVEFVYRFDLWFLQIKAIPSRRGRPLSSGTLNRFLAWTNAALNFAVKAGCLRENPIRHIEKAKETPRDITITEGQEARLLEVIDAEAPRLSPAVRYMLQVPCRAWSEVVKMRHIDLDLFHNCIRVRNGTTKNGAGIDKPIPPELVPYMRSIPAESEYVFYRRVNGRYLPLGRFAKTWMRCTRLAGLEGLRVHDLRHVAATRLVNAGTPEQVVMQVAGWKTNLLRVYYNRNPKKALELVRFMPRCENKCENIQAEVQR